MEDYQKYLDPNVLNKISRLDLKARLVVEGYISGLHRSPYHGFSVEFAQHREYVPGDDLRHMDWKVYGKSDRYYIKQYEEETNLVAYLLLDTSASMQYGSGAVSKFEYAATVAASLAYLLLQQQDAVGLVLFDEKVRHYLPASSNPGHLKNIIKEIMAVTPQAKTGIGHVLHDIAERLTKKGLVMVISDLFDDPAQILPGLRHFRHKKHEAIIFHILDPYELSFPFQRMTLFEGLEIPEKRLANPRALRNAYLEEVRTFIRSLKSGCLANRIDYVQISTDQSLDIALSTYLATRSGARR